MPRRRPPDDLAERFRTHLDALGLRGTGAHVLVALSGGRDSVVLLHLLRFHAGDPTLRLSAAHFDHAMRPKSERDARWAAGLCAAWNIPFATERAGTPPHGEAAAREARYAFLRRAQAELGATHLATAHHADDQAETVLFRVLRGTGPRGLAGIPARGPGGLVRPLLPFWRAEIARFASARRLRWRTDPTNRRVTPARNRIRLDLLPAAERHVARGARRNLVRLAELAAEDEAAWTARARVALDDCARAEGTGFVLVRGRFAGYDWPVASRALRLLLRRMGTVPDRAGTRLAHEFIRTASSGRQMVLPGGVRIALEFGEARLEPAAAGDGGDAASDAPLQIPGDAGDGAGTACIGGREYTVRWRTHGATPAAETGDWTADLAAERVAYPLTVRARVPGDRIRQRGGSRTLKRLFTDSRVPRGARASLPVVASADGAVLWVPGVATALEAVPLGGERTITLTIAHV
jgi:tRNA(Ile)-lysidine synthase